ncbi:PPK2 family polyphosphate kinase [Paraburkholderia dinghuensis]|uniref:Polyphosphate kinase 2 family protein n=1 Tax=Paraburkholderia dinghuensis TaxID=2305225 RepID=A0A3N6NTC9_9BURK|nr:PPK2 family polyphosphate kinase [Paraburkholderia dinghuensis]RQH03653.1 polyphosphate kinase 2 family protein [Paraburkholderia dinghuensis]
MVKSPSLDDYRVPFFTDKRTAKFALDAIDASAKPFTTGSKTSDRDRLAVIGAKIDVQQERLHAQHHRRVLLVLQGMDTSGKDGTIRGVFQDVDPLGLRIVAFRAPTPIESARDFLWRVHMQVPSAGELAIFNRSHYEDVLVPRVIGQIDQAEWERRYRQIREFEAMLSECGTTIIKCMLHISKDEQRNRIQARIDDPTKHWKFDLSDLEARNRWDAYQAAYRDVLAATSTEYAPWYVIPANSKSHRNVMVAELLLRALENLKLEFPPAKEELNGLKID